MSQRKRRVVQQQRPADAPAATARVVRLAAGRALLLPIAFGLLLAGF